MSYKDQIIYNTPYKKQHASTNEVQNKKIYLKNGFHMITHGRQIAFLIFGDMTLN